MTTRIALVAAVLLVATATLLAVGVALERSDHHQTTAQPHVDGPGGAGEAGHSDAGEATTQDSVPGSTAHRETSETKVLGIDSESTGVVTAVVLASLLLAGLVLSQTRPTTWVIAGLFALALVVFDIAEVVHQLDVSKEGLAALAAVVAVGHGIVGALAGLALAGRLADYDGPEPGVATPAS